MVRFMDNTEKNDELYPEREKKVYNKPFFGRAAKIKERFCILESHKSFAPTGIRTHGPSAHLFDSSLVGAGDVLAAVGEVGELPVDVGWHVLAQLLWEDNDVRQGQMTSQTCELTFVLVAS